MRKLILLSLLAVALPILCEAKNDGNTGPASDKLHLIENKGQVKDQFNNPRNDIQFTIPGKGISVFVGNGQLHYQFYNAINAGQSSNKPKSIKDLGRKNAPVEYAMYRMDVELIGANINAPVVKEDKQEFTASYHAIEATTDKSINQAPRPKGAKAGLEAHSYNKVTYKNVYPNIDWVLYIKDNHVEYEFEVRPGGNPANIKLKYKGATGVKVNGDGSLTATTPMGTISEAAPYSFQQDGSTVTSSFNLEGDVVSFNVGSYTGTLTIDPSLTWGTYYGSTGTEEYNSVVYDATGNVYATGGTTSPGNIATTGASQTVFGGLQDIFISKFSAAGALQWTTYVGGAADESGFYITYDAFSASVYVTGYTIALGDIDIYLCQFSSAGAFVWDILYGDVGEDAGTGVRCDAAGNQYLCGYSNSTTGMTTTGVIQTTNFGSYDGVITAFNAAGTVLWSTYYGGPGLDLLRAIGIDAGGNVYVAGGTTSTQDISTLNLYGGGGSDAFATKINNTATLWLWGAYYGGSGEDESFSAEVDATGNIYMAGYTTSTGNIATIGAFQTTYGGGTQDAFVSKHNTSGALTWSSYYGGNNLDEAHAIHVNSSNVFIGGLSESSNLNVTGGFQTTLAGSSDAFLAKLSLGGAFNWGTFYGGPGEDAINGLSSDNALAIYGAGITSSSTGIAFNTTVQSTISSGFDAFISRFEDCDLPGPISSITGPASICAGSTQTYSVAPVTGATSYTWTLPSGWTGTSTTNTISITASTTGGIISVTANNSCGSTQPQTLNVTVNPIPTASITAGGPTTFCQGGNVVLSANTGTGYTYQWFQGAPIPGATSSTYTATASGTYTVEITANGCEATSNAITVTVNPAPATPTANANVPCVGQALNLTASSTTSGVTYDWTGPNNFSNTQNPTIASAQLSDAGVYTVTVTLNGCTASTQVTVTVAPGAPATPGPITGDITVCEGSTETYTVPNDVNVGTYNWTLPTGWSGTSTTNSINATAGSAGGDIELTATNGCGTSGIATLTVTVNPLPTPVITQTGNTLSTTATYTSYQWYDGSGAIAGATNQSYTPTASGSYYVIVTDANGCTNQSNTLNITVSVNTISMAGDVALYPNPNDGNFTIKGQFNSNDGKVNIEVVDIAGRIVHKEQMTVKGSDLNKLINMNASLAPGVYTLKLRSDIANAVIPFVKK